MLKSTYKPASAASLPPLPDGWTEHQAPTGHLYYYNASTKTSTYTRPRPQPQGALDIGVNLQVGLQNSQVHSTLPLGAHGHFKAQSEPIRTPPFANGRPFQGNGDSEGRHGQYQRFQPKDRPRSKHALLGCEPWLLVKTKFGRRFAYNPELNQSFWKFPPDVMVAVVEYDRQEREKRQKIGQGRNHSLGAVSVAAAEVTEPTAAPRPTLSAPAERHERLDSDEEYEEVEVTDDEVEEDASKREKTKQESIEQAIDFDEQDIAYQLEAMGQDYGLDPGEYGDGEDDGLEEGAEGLPLTDADSRALFKDMLEDHGINPYKTWDALIEAGHIIEDDRYTVLPNMRSRKEVWSEWSRDKILRMKEQREKEEKKDPKIPYFAFLQAHATPKLYWPEFRRKYQKEPEMRNTKLTDKDREKWYREYMSRLKLPESTLKVDFVNLLKSIPLHDLNRSTTLGNVPPALLTDLRFISLRTSVRDALIEAHISILPPPPTRLNKSPEEEEAQAKEKHERERREQALAERQRQVHEEKRKQQFALYHSKGMLREGEQDVERAMRVGRQGLMGHKEIEKTQASEVVRSLD
ncbi:MAG: hypothetical protein Q9163_002904 [Psora crenata]